MTEVHWLLSVCDAANTSERKIIPSVAAETPNPQAGNAFARVLRGGISVRFDISFE